MTTFHVKLRKKRGRVGLLYILPWLVGFLLLQLYPFLSSLYYSFTQYNILKDPIWIGLDNFKNLFATDGVFLPSVKATFLYVAYSLPLRLIVAFGVAMLLNQSLKGIGVFRTAFYIPSLLGGSVAVAVVWRYLFGGNGPVNLALSALHLPSVNWLADANVAIFTISLLSVWQFGASMVVFLAGLKNIPVVYYEAAKVEGASSPRMFFSITLPLMQRIVMYNFIMEFIRSFQDFTAAFLITKGGPMNSTRLFSLKLYEDAFQSFRIGYAAAESWLLFAVLVVFTVLIFRVGHLWSFYTGGDRE